MKKSSAGFSGLWWRRVRGAPATELAESRGFLSECRTRPTVPLGPETTERAFLGWRRGTYSVEKSVGRLRFWRVRCVQVCRNIPLHIPLKLGETRLSRSRGRPRVESAATRVFLFESAVSIVCDFFSKLETTLSLSTVEKKKKARSRGLSRRRSKARARGGRDARAFRDARGSLSASLARAHVREREREREMRGLWILFRARWAWFSMTKGRVRLFRASLLARGL